MKDERRPICEVVAESIERLIIDGVLKVGQPLPSERRLCEKLGFSRSALREGLTVLRGRGIIETAQDRDSHVARLNREQDTSPLIHLFSTQPRTLYDLLDVRALLEGESARLAATLGTQADFVVITRCYEKMLAASENHKEISLIEHAQLDHAFHLAICQASHNQVLVFTLQSLTDLMFNSVFASVNNLYHRPQQKKQIDRQHARIYNAVLQRLPHVAQRAARSARSCTDREKESPRYRAGRPPFDSLGGAAGDEQGGNVSRVLPYPQGEGTAPALNRIWC
ncbi:transcriptional regulator GlcC [Shigella flexneri]|uniref:Transcriptional activator for glc operon n=1 Tax=Shigella flexneri serotype 5b (strain 8401) TaxID=373384 RepID=Q0T0R4_SHIF8|nr:transcriptional regulator GlcC [Shigella flexneri]ABF05101.1 transcriptional activator for glc operon [Shigella flexneri 5 str. 8401]EID63345.1 DNA-binding transcriptional regulator GlcC [Shigella flexneri 5a str. M90T]MCW3771857.1 transcriptional regulator GlcC [Shigella flexneri 5a str. M90T]